MKFCDLLCKIGDGIFKWFIFKSPSTHIIYDFNKTKRKLAHLTHLTEHLDTLELAASNQYDNIQNATNNLNIAVWGKNKHGRFVFLNEVCAEKILHGTVEAALNFTDADFKNDALARVCIKSDQLVMDSGITRRFIEHAEYDGVPFWVDCTKSPWIQNGKLIGTVGTAKNITALVSKRIKNKYKKAASIEIEVDMCIHKLKLEEIFK